jgi:hypothetical protein
MIFSGVCVMCRSGHVADFSEVHAAPIFNIGAARIQITYLRITLINPNQIYEYLNTKEVQRIDATIQFRYIFSYSSHFYTSKDKILKKIHDVCVGTKLIFLSQEMSATLRVLENKFLRTLQVTGVWKNCIKSSFIIYTLH